MSPNDAFGKLYVEQVRDRAIASLDIQGFAEVLLASESDGFEQVMDRILAHVAEVFETFLADPSHQFVLVEEEQINGEWIAKLTKAHDDPDHVMKNLQVQVLAKARSRVVRRLGTPTGAPGRVWWIQQIEEANAESAAMLFVAFVVDEVSADAMPWIQNNRFEFVQDGAMFTLKTDFAHDDYLEEGGWRDTYSLYPTKIY